MLSTNLESGNPDVFAGNPQRTAQQRSQRIEDYRSLYLQCADSPLDCLELEQETYDELYQLGCMNPGLSQKLEALVIRELKLAGYSQNDRFNTLFFGPYIQSQMLHHHMSESGAKKLVQESLKICSPPLSA